ncbi:MAG TPA: hypothetical protein VEU62_18530 [Bryobacterales bacterium]|nr:hypothetical protein [Bryobacterales bacterium]
MSVSKRVAMAFCCALLFAIFPGQADQWNKKTTMTFSQPVEIPGMVLPAGTYVFKLADSLSNRHIVQVFNADETHIYATILAIPDYRLQPTGETIVRFGERAASAPQGVKAWFYPGDSFGQEFVYPKARAMELAVATHEPVLAAEVTPTETPQQLEEAPVVAITPEKKEVQVEQVVQAKPAERTAPVAEPPAAPAELPKTASPLPLVALLGLSALGLGVALRAISRRVG